MPAQNRVMPPKGGCFAQYERNYFFYALSKAFGFYPRNFTWNRIQWVKVNSRDQSVMVALILVIVKFNVAGDGWGLPKS